MSYNYYLIYILAFAISFITAFAITPLVKKTAFKIGAVDVPKDNRRMHKQPIARLGGLAIFYGFALSMLIFSPLNKTTLSILIGSIIILTLGIIDDISPLKAKVKLIFQILAAVVVVFGGVEIKFITNPFAKEGLSTLDFYGISVFLTIFWIVGMTNAVNFIDGLDGLAVGVSSIAAMFLLLIGILNGRTSETILTVALVGSTLGFLPFNFNPAKIFMGDTGSNFLGFILSIISIQGTMKGYTAIAVAVPLLVLGLPIFDTAFAILRRIINRRPVMEADRGHLHHRLIDAGLSQKQSVLLLYIVSAFLGISAIVLTQREFLKFIILFSILIIFMILGFRHLKVAAEHQKHRAE